MIAITVIPTIENTIIVIIVTIFSTIVSLFIVTPLVICIKKREEISPFPELMMMLILFYFSFMPKRVLVVGILTE